MLEMGRRAKLHRNHLWLLLGRPERPMEMEEHQGNKAMSVDWTLAWQRLLHQLKVLAKRPIGLSGDAWTCSQDSAGGCGKMWLGMLRRASNTMTSSWQRTLFQPIVKVLDCSNMRKKLNYQNGARSSSSSSSGKDRKSFKHTAYLVRHATMLQKLKDLQVDVPALLAGWHLLTRLGVPCRGAAAVDTSTREGHV